MKKKYLFMVIVGLFLNLNTLNAQTEWTGPKITISKANFADWTLKENQDRITANVWLTRADSKGLFNIVSETGFDDTDYLSPLDTEWANGTIADGIGNLTFDTWDETNFSVSPAIDQNKVVHLVTDDIYIDIVITSWTKGAGGGVTNGGGFTYERSTDPNLGINDFELNKALHVFPNPSQDFIQITGLTNAQNIKIHNILGVKVLEEKIEANKKIDIINLGKGIYFIHFENGATLKFIKQ